MHDYSTEPHPVSSRSLLDRLFNKHDEQENRMKRWEVILQAGIEGGCLTLYGRYDGKQWVFSKNILDLIPEMIDEPVIYYCSEQMHSWDDALQMLDKHPWHSFYPLTVHPLFQGAVLAAVLNRSTPEMIASDDGFQHWLSTCSALPHVEWELAVTSK